MVFLAVCESPFSLNDLAAQIRNSSNFRFSWQFYQFHQYTGADHQLPRSVWQALEAMIATPKLHEFLRESFEAMYAETFEVKLFHEHCRVEAAEGDFESILARAASDYLGAYSQLRDATTAKKRAIKKLFGGIGEYRAYQLAPGNIAGCPACRNHNNHLFSSWFFGVAWDWCLIAVWPSRDLLWIGCLTDTD